MSLKSCLNKVRFFYYSFIAFNPLVTAVMLLGLSEGSVKNETPRINQVVKFEIELKWKKFTDFLIRVFNWMIHVTIFLWHE